MPCVCTGPSGGASTSAAPAAPEEDSDDDDIMLLSDSEGDGDDLQIIGEQPATAAADGAANGMHEAGTSAPARSGVSPEALPAARPADSATATAATAAGGAQGHAKRKREDDGDDAEAALKRQALALAGVAEQPPGLD